MRHWKSCLKTKNKFSQQFTKRKYSNIYKHFTLLQPAYYTISVCFKLYNRQYVLFSYTPLHEALYNTSIQLIFPHSPSWSSVQYILQLIFPHSPSWSSVQYILQLIFPHSPSWSSVQYILQLIFQHSPSWGSVQHINTAHFLLHKAQYNTSFEAHFPTLSFMRLGTTHRYSSLF